LGMKKTSKKGEGDRRGKKKKKPKKGVSYGRFGFGTKKGRTGGRGGKGGVI